MSARDCFQQKSPLVSSKPAVTILHKLNLGQHTLTLMSDQSITLAGFNGEAPSPNDPGMHLDAEETYRLFISLWEVFKQPEGADNHADAGARCKSA